MVIVTAHLGPLESGPQTYIGKGGENSHAKAALIQGPNLIETSIHLEKATPRVTGGRKATGAALRGTAGLPKGSPAFFVRRGLPLACFRLSQWRKVEGVAGFSGGEIDAFADVAPVPIPGAGWLLGSGLLGLIGIRRRLG